jgi:tRNA-splicing ligase RtcB
VRIGGDDLLALGLEPGPALGVALKALPRAVERLGRERALAELRTVAAAPDEHLAHAHFATVARRLVATRAAAAAAFVERDALAPFRSWCADVEVATLGQMRNALRLPSAVRGALMPDAHVGYGLPIGGVLATEGTVIPYGVGVDIACRMKLTVLDLPVATLDEQPAALGRALLVLLSADLGLEAGAYLAILSHSGSRGPGARVASHYTKLARALHPELPRELAHLAWLDLDAEPGQEYWAAMTLMGEFAAASHEVIHARLARRLRAGVVAGVENHHNFAWRERHDGRDVVVHRKGATPAGAGVLGVIPGSMATPGFVVRGRGVPESLESASHGAGRVMSRTAARARFTWAQVRPLLDAAGVRLLAAGIDENPLVYKDIEQVIAAQADLVEVVARFSPRIVRMADAGERPED